VKTTVTLVSSMLPLSTTQNTINGM